MSHEAKLGLQFSSQNQPFNNICLFSPNLQSDEIIISWILMMKLELFVAPNPSIHNSNSQILSLDSVSVDLPEENEIFLKFLPSLEVHPSISNDSPQWFDSVKKQRQLIKDNLIASYPLAFTEKNYDEVSYAAVAQIKISVDPGVRPTNRTTAVRCPYGHEVACRQFLEKNF